jgi:hypothetical protein
VSASAHQPSPVTPTSSASPSPTAARRAPDAPPQEATELPLTPIPTAIAPQDATSAKQVATRFVTTWTRHPSDRAAWWKSVRQMVTTALADQLATVDPAQISLGVLAAWAAAALLTGALLLRLRDA